MKDPLYKDSYLGITPPTVILPFEAPDDYPELLSPKPILHAVTQSDISTRTPDPRKDPKSRSLKGGSYKVPLVV